MILYNCILYLCKGQWHSSIVLILSANKKLKYGSSERGHVFDRAIQKQKRNRQQAESDWFGLFLWKETGNGEDHIQYTGNDCNDCDRGD